MKVVLIALSLMLGQSAFASWKSESRAILKEYAYACKNVEVNVDSIVRDEQIKGHVKGLPQEAYEKFKMVFYVKTNRWYVHPFVSPDSGIGHADIKEDGSFEIRTVRRDVPSKQLAAVLVPKPYLARSQRFLLRPLFGFIGGVLKYQCNHKIVQGNGDFLY